MGIIDFTLNFNFPLVCKWNNYTYRSSFIFDITHLFKFKVNIRYIEFYSGLLCPTTYFWRIRLSAVDNSNFLSQSKLYLLSKEKHCTLKLWTLSDLICEILNIKNCRKCSLPLYGNTLNIDIFNDFYWYPKLFKTTKYTDFITYKYFLKEKMFLKAQIHGWLLLFLLWNKTYSFLAYNPSQLCKTADIYF